MSDTRYVYGTRCTWHGPISEVGKTTSGIPCCPKCGAPLFEIESKDKWDRDVESFSLLKDEPQYPAFVESLREGPCHAPKEYMDLFAKFKEMTPS